MTPPVVVNVIKDDTESETESANGSSLDNLSSVVLLSENFGDIPIPELHDYILRKHMNTEEGFRAEFKGRMLCFYSIDIFIYLWLLSKVHARLTFLFWFVLPKGQKSKIKRKKKGVTI